MTGRKRAKKKIVIMGVLAFLVCAFLVFFISDYLEAQKAQRALSEYREQWRIAQKEKEQESPSEPAEEQNTGIAEAENPEPVEAAQQTESREPKPAAESEEPAAEPAAGNSDTAAKKEPAEQPDDWMPPEMREFDNADDYAEACFYDYFDILYAESLDPYSPLYGMDDVTLIKIAYDDAYDDWYRYH